MDSKELQFESEMSYKQLVEHLLVKYGPAEYAYFRNTSLSSVNPKVLRSSEGLYCHHIDEDKAIKLSSIDYAQKNTVEYQARERLVYCNLIEHLLLHIKITLEPRHPNANPDEEPGIGGIPFITGTINDYYNGYVFKKDHFIVATNLIENNFIDYIEILRDFIRKLKYVKNINTSRLDLVKWVSQKGYDRSDNNVVFEELSSPDEQDKIPPEELKLLEENANEGDPRSLIKLADLYGKGISLKQNKNLSFYYLEKAAEQDYLYALLMLGKYYKYGFGIETNTEKAFEYFMMVAEDEIDEAMYEVGEAYLKGKGVKEDIKKAYFWFSKAAEKGYANAQYEMGNYYKKLKKTEKTIKESKKWYELAAEQNHPFALQEVAFIYLRGIGVKEDKNKAKYYLEQSYKYGNIFAKNHLKNLFD